MSGFMETIKINNESYFVICKNSRIKKGIAKYKGSKLKPKSFIIFDIINNNDFEYFSLSNIKPERNFYDIRKKYILISKKKTKKG